MKEYKFDPSLNILYKEHNNLDYIFNPKTIAIIGATDKENSVGKTLVENLVNSSFQGEVFLVNPKRESILGQKAYPSIDKIDKKIDLAIIATPSKTVPGIIDELEAKNVSAAIIISAGFKELGESGKKLEDQILQKKKKIRIIGPNCLGIMNPSLNLNATFAKDMPKSGNIAFISQSGALGTAVLDWSLKEEIGFSAFVSIGSMIDVDFGDLINYFGDDPNTKSILMYMENISDPRSFLSAAREVALTKPIILIKAGRTKESAHAAMSHTGALAGSDEVLDAALKRVGILRVNTINDLFSMNEILSKQPIPKGPNFAIVTNAGGPAVIATDSLIIHGAKIATLQDSTYEKLDEFLPAAWSHNNPIDILGDATADLYYKTLKVLIEDDNVEGILVILTPQFMTDATLVANKIKEFSDIGRPIFAAWMGAKSVEDGRNILASSNIPDFEFPDQACRSFGYMWSYCYNMIGIYETAKIQSKIATQKEIKKRVDVITEVIKKARDENRVILDEFESKNILKAFDIPIVETFIAKDLNETIEFSKKIGYPVVLKVFSKEITHKTDVGGVKLNLHNESEVKDAFIEIQKSLKDLGKEKYFDGVTVQKMVLLDGYELILGSTVDSDFGPIMLFGTGGELVEVYKDKAIALPPLTITLAKRLIERTKIFQALKGVRGKKAVDLEKLEKIVVDFSSLITQYPEIKECDINPLLATENGIIALDARIILHEKQEIYPKLSIKPYPLHLVQDNKLKDETPIVIRPIHPDDEPLMREFYKDVSEKSLKEEYFKSLHYDELVAHERLIRMCFIDYDREITLVAQLKDSDEIIAIGRFTKLKNSKDGFFSLLVKDKYHKKGLGKKLLDNIIKIAKEEKREYLVSQMLEDNTAIKNLCKSFGFSFEKIKDHPVIRLSLKL
ncbi:MAG: Succinyl-CoA ligase [ADP-forming] subunit alpha [Candidatus Anoxychlamydiales bacterium]|nr:Succinyl-CoA ligase [ADP-forming] subunit alpha [Candidatus Anoxychlamydiales bacterium]